MTVEENPSAFVDMKVNGSDGPLSMAYGKKMKVSWESKGVESCDLVYPTKKGDAKRVAVKTRGTKSITAYPSSSPDQIHMACDVKGGGGAYTKDAVYIQRKFEGTSSPAAVLGSPNAKVEIVTYCDTESPFCRPFIDTMYKVVDYYTKGAVNSVNWNYELLPNNALTGPASIPEAQGVMCAASLAGGGSYFWNSLAALAGGSYTNAESMFTQLVLPKSVDKKSFVSCVNGADTKMFEKRFKDAVTVGLQGIPYTVMTKGNEKEVVNGNVPYDLMNELVYDFLHY